MSTDSPQPLRWWMDERRGELGLTWQQVANEAGTSTETLYRAAEGRPMRTTTRKGIERALQWEHGSIEAIRRGGRPRNTPATHSGLTSRQGAAEYPAEWTSTEEEDYQEKYPVWNPLMQTQEMEFTRQAYRTMRDEFRKIHALQQFTQGERSDVDSDVSPDRRTDK